MDTLDAVPHPPGQPRTPQSLRWTSGFSVLADAASAFFRHRGPSSGAAVAYYTLFSMAPMLLVAIAVAGAAFGEEAARGELFRQLASLIGSTGASAVQSLLASVDQQGQGGWGTGVGVALLLVGATTVFAELQRALDTVWSDTTLTQRRGPKAPWWTLLRARLMAFGALLAIGFLLVVSLLLDMAVTAVGEHWRDALHGWDFGVSVLNSAASTLLLVVLFAMLFRFMPTVRVPWRQVWLGAWVTAGLFALCRSAIGWYIGNTAVDSGFGAAGSLVAVLVWVYVSSQVFLFGAEITRAVAVFEGRA